MRRLLPGLVAFTTSLLVALSGCASKAPNASSDGTPVAAEPEVDAQTGAIHGVVTDTSLVPLPNVKVGLVETRHETLTDEAGRFTFSRLAPGPYRLSAFQFGYGEALRTVHVVAAHVEELGVQLEPTEDLTKPRSHVMIYQGRIQCGVSNAAFWLLICEAADPTGATWKFNFTYDIDRDATGQLWEQTWLPSQLLSRDLAFRIERAGCGATCTSAETFASDVGCCYLRIALDDAHLDKGAYRIGANGGLVQSRTSPAGGLDQQPANLFVDQPFTIYWEQFWGPLPQNFGTDRTNVPA